MHPVGILPVKLLNHFTCSPAIDTNSGLYVHMPTKPTQAGYPAFKLRAQLWSLALLTVVIADWTRFSERFASPVPSPYRQCNILVNGKGNGTMNYSLHVNMEQFEEGKSIRQLSISVFRYEFPATSYMHWNNLTTKT